MPRGEQLLLRILNTRSEEQQRLFLCSVLRLLELPDVYAPVERQELTVRNHLLGSSLRKRLMFPSARANRVLWARSIEAALRLLEPYWSTVTSVARCALARMPKPGAVNAQLRSLAATPMGAVAACDAVELMVLADAMEDLAWPPEYTAHLRLPVVHTRNCPALDPFRSSLNALGSMGI